MKRTFVMLMMLAAFGTAFTTTSCRNEKKDNDNKIEKAADDVGDAIDNAADDVGDAVDDVGDAVDDATDDN